MIGTGITTLLAVLLNRTISIFSTRKTMFYPLFIILAVFTTGFMLRLSGNQAAIDFGFFLTEVSHIFIYMLFTAALLLGQKKYWRI